MAIDFRLRFPHDLRVTAHLLLALMLAACSAPEPLSGNVSGSESARAMKGAAVETNQGTAGSGEGVAGLPFAHGKSFASLDEYLSHLERFAAPIDQPWWREIRPGVYEHVKRMPEASPEIATRDELMRRFGFSR